MTARHPCAGKQTLAAVWITWKWQEAASTTVNADELAIAVLQLGATPPRPPTGVTWRSRAEADSDGERIRAGRAGARRSRAVPVARMQDRHRGRGLAAVVAAINAEALRPMIRRSHDAMCGFISRDISMRSSKSS
jgi:hypothetical protein